MNDIEFGNRVKHYRIVSGYTQLRLAQLLNVSQATVSNYEKGVRYPSQRVLFKLVDILNVDINDLIKSSVYTVSDKNDLRKFNVVKLVNLLLTKDYLHSYEYVLAWSRALNYGLKDIYLKIIVPTLYEIGDRWFEHEVLSVEEHIVSFKLTQIVNELANAEMIRTQPKPLKKRIISICAPSENHKMALLLCTQLLRLKGYETHFIGDCIPLNDLKTFISTTSPHALLFSITMPNHMNGLCSYLERLVITKTFDYRILVGGNGANAEHCRSISDEIRYVGSIEETVGSV